MIKNISLSLSGGAMRGYAHIGVLKRIEELQLKSKFISGSSIGAIIGAFVADGFAASEIQEIFLRSDFSFDINFFGLRESLLSNKKIKDLLVKNLRSRKFEELGTELFVCVTDYLSGKPEFIHKGDLIPVLLASSAIPLLYKPVNLGGKHYIDGGLSSNLPTLPLLETGLSIIGSHVNPATKNLEKSGLSKKIDHLVHLLLRDKIESSRKHCKVFIEPEKLEQYALFETKSQLKIIGIGYEEACKCLTKDSVNGI